MTGVVVGDGVVELRPGKIEFAVRDEFLDGLGPVEHVDLAVGVLLESLLVLVGFAIIAYSLYVQ